MGIAVLGSISTAVYRGQITDAGTTGEPADAVRAARDTLGGAAGVADQLPAALLTTANEAFTSGMQVAAAISAVALAAMAVLAAGVLRRMPTDASQPSVPVRGSGAEPGDAITGIGELAAVK